MSRESKELHAMRAMAWERAKGELRSMGHTFYSECDRELENRFWNFDRLVNEFIKAIEDDALHE